MAQFWGTFHEGKYRINSFVQNIWTANFHCNEFVETSYTTLFFESPWNEQDSSAPIFSMYMTLAQKTREDVKYFKNKLYLFFCNYLEYHLASWGSNLRNLLVNTFIYHHYFHLGQSFQEYTKIYLVHSWILCPNNPCHRDMEYYGGEMILQRLFVAGRQNFKVKHGIRDYIKLFDFQAKKCRA